MNIKLDENIPSELAEFLQRLGHSTDTVHAEGLSGRPDPEVWEAAQRGQRFLITQDLDFADIRKFQPGAHAGLLLVRLREPTLRRLIDRLTAVLESADLSAWRGCVAILSDARIRVRRPREDHTRR
ncbi:MAG: DUF5615 family PIN-like protein [Planctomycetota bacterium]